MRDAPSFQVRIRPSRFVPITASSEDFTIAPRNAAARSYFLRSVTSLTIHPRIERILPSSQSVLALISTSLSAPFLAAQLGFKFLDGFAITKLLEQGFCGLRIGKEFNQIMPQILGGRGSRASSIRRR